MKTSTLLQKLKNIGIEFKAKNYVEIFGGNEQNFYSRVKRNSEFSEDDLKQIEQKFAISLFGEEDCITIQHIHINPSCGSGTVVMDEPEITPVKLGKKLIESVLRVSDVNNLRTFTASGDSMTDTIDDGNLLLVDMGRKDFNNGGIFVLQKNNEWFVKRLQLRFSGELDIISDNPKYKTDTIKPNDDIEIIVKGKVIKNLSKGL